MHWCVLKVDNNVNKQRDLRQPDALRTPLFFFADFSGLFCVMSWTEHVDVFAGGAAVTSGVTEGTNLELHLTAL